MKIIFENNLEIDVDTVGIVYNELESNYYKRVVSLVGIQENGDLIYIEDFDNYRLALEKFEEIMYYLERGKTEIYYDGVEDFEQ